MELSIEQFTRLFPALQRPKAELYLPHYLQSCERFAINTELRQAAYAAQIGHESIDLSRWIENLTYTTAERICAVWPGRFKTIASAKPFVRNPQGLANQAYAGRMGNDQPGDGWRFRGRAPLQATGRDMYSRAGRAIGQDFVANPDLLLQPEWGFLVSAWIFAIEKRGLSLCDSGTRQDFTALTWRINGGTNGLPDRLQRWKRAQEVLGVQIVKG